jgi:hypothetical protein
VTPQELSDEERELFEQLSRVESPAEVSQDGGGFWQKVKDALFD